MSKHVAQLSGVAIGAILLAGLAVPPTAQAASEVLTVNLAQNTGAFHGGASGYLYGVYGKGLPTDTAIAGLYPKTLATKSQDGPQHPGADALEVTDPFVDNGGEDVYIYMTDLYRGFPYQWPGSTGPERMNDYKQKLTLQVEQVLASGNADHIVYVPFNEPEGNMFGTGTWSYNNVNWLNNPTAFYQAWQDAFQLIKSLDPDARIAGPNTIAYHAQDIRDFFIWAKNTCDGDASAAGQQSCIPDVMTWHELSSPASVRTNVAKYRALETEVGFGPLPINIDEYAYRYHLSVPGQMVQWMSAIEESKIDADLAYWNIDGNMDDTTVEANKGNGQWWLYNAYGQMTGNTVAVTPPQPNVQYTLQGVASLDTAKKQARLIFGGKTGEADIAFTGIPANFGSQVHVTVQEIPWTGQVGDSAQPIRKLDFDATVAGAAITIPFTDLKEQSAYQVILSPGGNGSSVGADLAWSASYEAETATLTGASININTEGTPGNVSKFAASGTKDVGGIRTGSDAAITFSVTVPTTGTYDLSVMSSSLRTDGEVVADNVGPATVFMRVDGANPRSLTLPVEYGWVVFDNTDAKVDLTAGTHTISLSMQDATLGAGTGDVLIDKIDLSLPNATLAGQSVYEAEYTDLRAGAVTDYSTAGVSGSGTARLANGQSATFWVYAKADGAASVSFDRLAGGAGSVEVNGTTVSGLSIGSSSAGTDTVPLFLSGGINKVTVTGTSGTLALDRIRVIPAAAAIASTSVEAEAGVRTGTAVVSTAFDLASGGSVVTGLGDSPSTNNLTVSVNSATAGQGVLTMRYANAEFAVATHYNPDPIARHADVSVNGAAATRVLFANSFHWNQFWDISIPVTLVAGTNTFKFSGDELPNWDGMTFNEFGQRSAFLPNLDKVSISRLAGAKSTTAAAATCVVGTRCEGEAATLSGGAVVATDHTGYTGTGFVAAFTTAGAQAAATINVTSAGTYPLTLRYSAGANGPSAGVDRTVSILVNGAATQQIALPKTTNWDSWKQASIPIALPAGTSTIAVRYGTSDTGWINLDSLLVSNPGSCAVGVACESESATRVGSALVATDHMGYTGTGFVAGITSVGAGTTQSVSVGTVGTYSLVIRYSAGPNGPSSAIDRTMTLLVNGVAQTVTLPRTTTWDVWAEQSVSLSLPAGTSTIALAYQSANTGWVNLDNIRVTTP